MRDAMGEVVGCIQGINDPQVRIVLRSTGCAFLAKETVLRELLLQQFGDELLRFQIGLGDEVMRELLVLNGR